MHMGPRMGKGPLSYRFVAPFFNIPVACMIIKQAWCQHSPCFKFVRLPAFPFWQQACVLLSGSSENKEPCDAGELSSLPQAPLQEMAEQEGPVQQQDVPRAYPSGSLLSTAVRPLEQQPQHQPPLQHMPQQPPSPRANRANSLVSKTPREANRAGTPASVYGQGRSLGRQLRADSPFGYEQVWFHPYQRRRHACKQAVLPKCLHAALQSNLTLRSSHRRCCWVVTCSLLIAELHCRATEGPGG